MAARKHFPDSVVPLPRSGIAANFGALVQPAANPDNARLTLHFAFGPDPKAQAAIEARVARGEVVPPGELTSTFHADPAKVAALEAWLTARGFHIDHVSPDGIYASGTGKQVAASLEVKLVEVTRDGFTRVAARSVPSLPADIGAPVTDIGGLQPFVRAQRHSRLRAPLHGNRSEVTEPTFGLRAQSVAVPNQPPYLVSEIRKAYGGAGVTADGSGQTIAILIDTFPDDADLAAFWTANGLPVTPARIEKINVKGGTLGPPQGEESLDAQWTSGIAPGATIRIYASGSLAFVDLDRALDAIIADTATIPGLRQLSISLGLGETFLGGPDGETATQHAKYLQLTAAGVNVFVSSGDAGSNPDATGQGSAGPLQAEYPAADSAVTAVGGTTLQLAADGRVTSETGWSGSGGGASAVFDRPVWQTGSHVPRGSKRLVPDVALVADPNTGAFLVLSGKVVQIGGTSWSAPVWAAVCALINSSRIAAGKPALGFINPLLYPLTSGLRDIVGGSNGAFEAGVGYDEVTGLGVPDIGALVAALG